MPKTIIESTHFRSLINCLFKKLIIECFVNMNLLPKIKSCPCCNSLNLIKINGVSYENNFLSLKDWVLKKIFNCRKCRVKLGLFAEHANIKGEMIVWIDLLKCEEAYYKNLTNLQKSKEKLKKQNKKYEDVIKEINDIQNKIRLDQVKVKIKAKIQNPGIFVRHA